VIDPLLRAKIVYLAVSRSRKALPQSTEIRQSENSIPRKPTVRTVEPQIYVVFFRFFRNRTGVSEDVISVSFSNNSEYCSGPGHAKVAGAGMCMMASVVGLRPR